MHVLRDWPSKIMCMHGNVSVEYLMLSKLVQHDVCPLIVHAEYRTFFEETFQQLRDTRSQVAWLCQR